MKCNIDLARGKARAWFHSYTDIFYPSKTRVTHEVSADTAELKTVILWSGTIYSSKYLLFQALPHQPYSLHLGNNALLQIQ